MSPLSTGCNLTGSLANSPSSSWVSTCGSFIVGHCRSGTLNGAPSEMTAFMGSSYHIFFPPWVQLNLTSSWLQKKKNESSLTVGLQIVEGPLSWACHGELFCELAQIVRPAPLSSSLSESLICDGQFGRCSCFLALHT